MKIAAIAIILLIIIILIHSYLSVSSEKPVYFASPTPHRGLRIGIIGDSWVAGKRLDTIIANQLPCTIFSVGHPGAKTKQIYHELLNDDNWLFHKSLDYCIVLCGVNDAVGQVGAENYSFHLNLIVSELLLNHIKPVVVELPEFGIIEYNKSFNIFKNTKNNFFALINGSSSNDINEYRSALMLPKEAIMIDFDSVCDNYQKNKELYSNPAHLSLKGNQKLGSYIANNIYKDLP